MSTYKFTYLPMFVYNAFIFEIGILALIILQSYR